MVVNMSDYAEFNEEDVQNEFNKYQEEGNAIFEDDEKRTKLLDKVSKLCRKLKNLPVIGDYVEMIADVCEMIQDVTAGRYKSSTAIISAGFVIGALVYLVSPLDFIPDVLPIIGYLDDVKILELAFNTIEKELNDYLIWKNY